MENRHPHRTIPFVLSVICGIMLTACNNSNLEPRESSKFQYPPSKFWAHCVSTVELGRTRAQHFDGMEVDLNYSTYQNQLFMGHELWDTVKGLSLDMWLDSIPTPADKCYWLDIKNLNTDNASDIAHLILNAARRHGIVERIMVENWDAYALRIVKDSGLHVILWTDNPYWSGCSEEEFRSHTQKQIDLLHPDALSGDWHNCPRLPEAFPDYNIHIWDTPREDNDTNHAHSIAVARHPNVRVVLVDYPYPPDL